MPSVFVQGRPVDAYPPLAPEARRGKGRRVTEGGEEVVHKPCRDGTGWTRYCRWRPGATRCSHAGPPTSRR